MKLTRLLLLVPAAGLLMAGCDKDKEPEKSVSSIAVSGTFKQAYAVNEGFEKTGLVVTATYSDDSKEDVSASASFSGFSSAEEGSKTVTVSFGEKSTTFNVEVKEGYEFKAAKEMYAKAGISGLIVPSYFAEDIYARDMSGIITIATTAEEFEDFKDSLVHFGWEEGEGYEEEGFAISEFSFGESSFCEIMDGVEDYGAVAVMFGQDEVELEAFPADGAAKYLESAGVAGVKVPAYAAASSDAYFVLDPTYEGYYDVYAAVTTSEELLAYKDLLVENGWVVIGEADGDFRLQYGETYAFVDLLDYTSEEDPEEGVPAFVEISFFVNIPVDAPEVVVAINEVFASILGEDLLEYDEEYEDWYGKLVMSEESEENVDAAPEELLQPAAAFVASVMPESLGEPTYTFYASEDHYFGQDDNTTVAEFSYEVGEYVVDVFAYCDHNVIYVAVDVYIPE